MVLRAHGGSLKISSVDTSPFSAFEDHSFAVLISASATLWYKMVSEQSMFFMFFIKPTLPFPLRTLLHFLSPAQFSFNLTKLQPLKQTL